MSRRRTFRRSHKVTFCEVSFDEGACAIHFGKPRQTALHEMRHRCPNFLKSIELLYKVSKGEAVEEEAVVMPASEVTALSVYLAATATKITGWEDEDGAVIRWEELSQEEQVDFFECLPMGWSQQCFGKLLMAMAFEDDPDLADRFVTSVTGDEEE